MNHSMTPAAKTRPTTDRPRPGRRRAVRRWVRRAFLSACLIAVAQVPDHAAQEFPFEQHDLVTGPAKGQTVLTGFFLGGPVAELAVIRVDRDDDRSLRIYAFDDGTWRANLDAPLRPDVSFVDVVHIDGRDRLIAYGRGRLSWFDPASATVRPLVAVTSDFVPPVRAEVPHVNVSRDVNGDGRDDLVVPDVDGFWVLAQTTDGTFADPVLIRPPAGSGRIYGVGGYRHSPWLQGGVHEMDYDRDGRSDLVYWKSGRLEVHFQDRRGSFSPEPKGFPVDVALDGGRNVCSRRPADGFDAVEACYEADHSLLTTGDLQEKMLHAVTDVNGDGVDDLVVFSLEGRSVFSVRSAYEVHLGTPSHDGRTVFRREVDTSAGSRGMPGWMEQHDFDGDGQLDTMSTSLKVGFFKAIGGLLTRSTSLDLEFYRMENGVYPDEPDATRKIELDLSRQVAGKKSVAYAPVLIGDVNGDRRSDLLIGGGRKRLQVFLGVPGPQLFAEQPQTVAVTIPRGQEYVWLTDLDGDGKQDVVLHHASATEPHRVTLLVAR